MTAVTGRATDTAVCLVEDHDVMRETLVDAIDRMAGFVVTVSVESGEAALAAIERSPVELMVIDMSLPRMNGSDLVAAVRRAHPDVLCLVLSGHRERQYVERALRAGAHGYVVKGRPHEIEAALRSVAAGERYVSSSLHD